MPKLSLLEEEEEPTKVVDLVLANSRSRTQVLLRLLSNSQRISAIRAAKAAHGKEWDDDDKECELQLQIEIVSRATFDVDKPDELWCEGGPDQLRESKLIGQENIQYLYEAYKSFAEDYSIQDANMTRAEALTLCYRLAEGDDGPLDLMPLGTQRAFMRFTASLLWNLVKDRSLDTLGGSTDIKSSSKTHQSEGPARDDPSQDQSEDPPKSEDNEAG